MAAANTETAFPAVLGAYIDARRTLAGLPDADTLPVVTAISDEDDTFPKIFIAVSQIENPHRSRQNLTVVVELQTRMEKTTPETEDGWLHPLHRLLNDTPAFRAWLSEQSPSFSLRRMRVTGIASGVNTEKQLRGRSTTLAAHLRSHELSPMPLPA